MYALKLSISIDKGAITGSAVFHAARIDESDRAEHDEATIVYKTGCGVLTRLRGHASGLRKRPHSAHKRATEGSAMKNNQVFFFAFAMLFAVTVVCMVFALYAYRVHSLLWSLLQNTIELNKNIARLNDLIDTRQTPHPCRRNIEQVSLTLTPPR